MKAEKKPLGTKAQIRAKKEKERLIATVVLLTLITTMIALSTYFAYTILSRQSSEQEFVEPSSQFKPETPNLQLKAAIVDQLSLTFPNQTFIETSTRTLTGAGYTVDYFSGEKVTVEFYRNLPTHGYVLIILRVHSTATNPDTKEAPVMLFTSERYDRSKHVHEQLTDQLALVAFSQDEMKEGITYFGINPLFVTRGMNGRFQSSIIIMMGCEGLHNTLMAEAFVEKGAKVYIGWNQPVSGSHTDTATTQSLRHFLIEKLTLRQSVQETFKEVGFDPICKGLLIYYPLEVGEQTIESVNR